MDQYQEYSIYSGKSNNIFSVKLLEITFIFFIIFSVICKITNHEFIHYSGVISKIINFVVSKLVNYLNKIFYILYNKTILFMYYIFFFKKIYVYIKYIN